VLHPWNDSGLKSARCAAGAAGGSTIRALPDSKAEAIACGGGPSRRLGGTQPKWSLRAAQGDLRVSVPTIRHLRVEFRFSSGSWNARYGCTLLAGTQARCIVCGYDPGCAQSPLVQARRSRCVLGRGARAIRGRDSYRLRRSMLRHACRTDPSTGPWAPPPVCCFLRTCVALEPSDALFTGAPVRSNRRLVSSSQATEARRDPITRNARRRAAIINSKP
jgi:hypothetical protein